ncbi:hypothetical protein MP638_005966 [Amoeboaphelidium occidentale]|nr:hypothetical protein MP638_005966 [Amoeboaphelidium occidentale]
MTRNFLNTGRLYSSAAPAVAKKSRSVPVEKIRNIAIIAHGKSMIFHDLISIYSGPRGTQLGSLAQEVRVMDSNTLEKERGITIFSKTASISYKDFRINIVDTPGHADFGGEVERVLSMVDGCVLVVDASEGPMTQTRFVLNKALNRNLKTVVVLNKADRPTTRLDEVQSEILDLFLNLNAADDQLDYPVLFASAKEGWAVKNWDDDKKADMNPLFEQIISSIPSPKLDRSKPFSMLVTQLESDPFVGRCVLGRIQSGSISVGDKMKCLDENGKVVGEGKVLKMFSRDGLSKEIIEHAGAGEIISIAGVPMAGVNITLCDSSLSEPIESVPIDPPTVSMFFSVNDSPLQGEHGSKLTSGMIRDRLMKEIETNVAMQVIESDQKDSFEVRGRGELHLGVLIENMRREGFELSVSPPRVIMKKTDNQLLEPMEEVTIDVPLEYGGAVIQKLNKRKGEMKNYVEQGDRLKLSFEIPSRGLLGYVSEFKNETSGQGIINHLFIGYQPYKGPVDKSRKGSLISTATGTTTAHALEGIETRGTLFVKPGEKVYEGCIVGENTKDQDLLVNPVKTKELTNVRAMSKDDIVKLTPPRVLSLEQMLSYMQDDEILEVTPATLRIRKKILDPNRRKAMAKKQTQ